MTKPKGMQCRDSYQRYTPPSDLYLSIRYHSTPHLNCGTKAKDLPEAPLRQKLELELYEKLQSPDYRFASHHFLTIGWCVKHLFLAVVLPFYLCLYQLPIWFCTMMCHFFVLTKNAVNQWLRPSLKIGMLSNLSIQSAALYKKLKNLSIVPIKKLQDGFSICKNWFKKIQTSIKNRLVIFEKKLKTKMHSIEERLNARLKAPFFYVGKIFKAQVKQLYNQCILNPQKVLFQKIHALFAPLKKIKQSSMGAWKNLYKIIHTALATSKAPFLKLKKLCIAISTIDIKAFFFVHFLNKLADIKNQILTFPKKLLFQISHLYQKTAETMQKTFTNCIKAMSINGMKKKLPKIRFWDFSFLKRLENPIRQFSLRKKMATLLPDLKSFKISLPSIPWKKLSFPALPEMKNLKTIFSKKKLSLPRINFPSPEILFKKFTTATLILCIWTKILFRHGMLLVREISQNIGLTGKH